MGPVQNNGEEIKRLAELGAHMEHVLRRLDDIGDQLAKLVTQAEHFSLIDRVRRLEEKVEGQSPLNLWKKATAVAVGITAFASVVGLIVVIARKMPM